LPSIFPIVRKATVSVGQSKSITILPPRGETWVVPRLRVRVTPGITNGRIIIRHGYHYIYEAFNPGEVDWEIDFPRIIFNKIVGGLTYQCWIDVDVYVFSGSEQTIEIIGTGVKCNGFGRLYPSTNVGANSTLTWTIRPPENEIWLINSAHSRFVGASGLTINVYYVDEDAGIEIQYGSATTTDTEAEYEVKMTEKVTVTYTKYLKFEFNNPTSNTASVLRTLTYFILPAS